MGRALRRALSAIPLPATVRVIQGPLKGAAWVRASGTAGCWLGSYEIGKQKALASTLKPGHTFYDIGAHAGLYSLLADRLVGPLGTVVAFEPDPRNLANLRRHIAINGTTNVSVIPAAVGRTTGTVQLSLAASSYENRLSDSADTPDTPVQCYALDDAVTRLALPLPDCIKIDTEGAEVDVLRGAANILSTARPVIFLATHSPDLHASCAQMLRELHYRIHSIGGGPWESTDELLAVPAI